MARQPLVPEAGIYRSAHSIHEKRSQQTCKRRPEARQQPIMLRPRKAGRLDLKHARITRVQLNLIYAKEQGSYGVLTQGVVWEPKPCLRFKGLSPDSCEIRKASATPAVQPLCVSRAGIEKPVPVLVWISVKGHKLSPELIVLGQTAALCNVCKSGTQTCTGHGLFKAGLYHAGLLLSTPRTRPTAPDAVNSQASLQLHC